MGATVPTPESPPAWAVPTPEFPPAWAVPAATVAGGLRSGPATAGSRGRVAGGAGVVVDAACGDPTTARPRAACVGGAGGSGRSGGGRAWLR
jgi:hypothetical protein